MFVIDGVVDVKCWVYIFVCIVYSRFKNFKGIDLILFGIVN